MDCQQHTIFYWNDVCLLDNSISCKMDREKNKMNNPDAIYVYIFCGMSYVFMLFFIWTLLKSAAMADKEMEHYQEELKKNLDHEN